MEASRITVSQKTLESSSLKRGDKTRIRKQLALDYISRKPYSSPINLHDLGAELGTSSANAWTILQTLVKEGKLVKQDSGLRKVYLLVGPVRTKQLAKAPTTTVDKEPTPPPALEPTGPDLRAVRYAQQLDAGMAMMQFAKDFYWETTSNNLHEFVEWLEAKRR